MEINHRWLAPHNTYKNIQDQKPITENTNVHYKIFQDKKTESLELG